MPDDTPERPGYAAPASVPIATREQQKPMLKLLGRMMKMKHPGKPSRPASRSHAGKKGLQANQTVAIKHKQIFY